MRLGPHILIDQRAADDCSTLRIVQLYPVAFPNIMRPGLLNRAVRRLRKDIGTNHDQFDLASSKNLPCTNIVWMVFVDIWHNFMHFNNVTAPIEAY